MKFCTRAAIDRIFFGLLLALGSCVLLSGVAGLFGRRRVTTLPQPAETFREETGIVVAKSWQVVASGTNHGRGHEGETHVILEFPEDTTERLLESKPPWSAKWQHGPVPCEIGFHCGFGTDGVTMQRNGGTSEYSGGNKELNSLLSSPSVFYDAKERCCNGLRWHNGHLVIVDPTKNRIWLSKWDY